MTTSKLLLAGIVVVSTMSSNASAQSLEERVKRLEENAAKAVKYNDVIRLYSGHPLDTNRCISFPGDLSVVQNYPCSLGNVGADAARSWWSIKKKE
jgi:hypothetical protein